MEGAGAPIAHAGYDNLVLRRPFALTLAIATLFVSASPGFAAVGADPSNPYAEQPKPCVVPALRGKTLPKAKLAIVKAGCKVGEVKRRVTKKTFVGKVVSQSPAPDKRLKHSAVVSMTVGRAAS